ncbi:MAG: pilin [Candidatus Peribacteria bacterium]|nr:pilin [Candidatus Peribacteria bacterium]
MVEKLSPITPIIPVVSTTSQTNPITEMIERQIQEAAQKAAEERRNEAQRKLGIVMNTGCMTSMGCSMDIGVMLGLKTPASAGSEEANRTSILTFVQDVVLAATFFIGTVITLALIWSGLLFIFSAADSSKKKVAISGMKNAVIGLALVAGSYAIIRFIQFLASGG